MNRKSVRTKLYNVKKIALNGSFCFKIIRMSIFDFEDENYKVDRWKRKTWNELVRIKVKSLS